MADALIAVADDGAIRTVTVQRPDKLNALNAATLQALAERLGGEYGVAVEVLPGGLARVRGVSDRDAAARLTGVRLYVPREALPPTEEDEFYLSDLIGLSAVGEDGVVLGRIVSVDDFGGGAFVTLRDAKGRDREIPFTRACVPVVDVAGGRCTVVPPEEIVVQPESDSEKGEGEAA